MTMIPMMTDLTLQQQKQQHSSSTAVAEVSDVIASMRGLEARVYACEDYLNKGSSTATADGGNTSPCQSQLSSRWRAKICEWNFKMVDHFDFTREVVSISLSYLDRFLSATQKTKGVSAVDPHLAQLAAMTSLHLAVKLHEPRKIKMSSLADLSRGHFTTEMIEQMELNILSTLGWYVHPTTSLQFVDQFAKLLQLDASVKEDVFEVARFLTELAVCDGYFVSALSSNVAYACVIVALEFGGAAAANSLQSFISNMSAVANMHVNDVAVQAARERMREIYIQSAAFQKPVAAMEGSPTSTSKMSSIERSPTCVADGGKAFASSQ